MGFYNNFLNPQYISAYPLLKQIVFSFEARMSLTLTQKVKKPYTNKKIFLKKIKFFWIFIVFCMLSLESLKIETQKKKLKNCRNSIVFILY